MTSFGHALGRGARVSVLVLLATSFAAVPARVAAQCGTSRPKEPVTLDGAPGESAGTPQASPLRADVAAPRIPDAAVTDQDGRSLKFYTDLVKGRTVAINFIYTTDTTTSPPKTATLWRVQRLLGERVGKDVFLISVSVDPTTDTPERLKSFAEKFKAGPGWTFVTGEKSEIDSLLRAFGALTDDKKSHSVTLLVGNEPAGRWTRAYGFARAALLVKIIEEAVAAPSPK
jgi:protein SCO1